METTRAFVTCRAGVSRFCRDDIFMERGKSLNRAVFLLILLAGIFLRANALFQNRSLWLDEAYVANHVLAQSAKQLIQNIPYDKNLPHAPAGFLLIEKGAVGLFGNAEFSLRLFPFLCGCSALFLFFLFVRNFLSGLPAHAAMFFFAFSDKLIYYSSVCKPYSCDVLVGMAIPAAVFYARAKKYTPSSCLFLFITGAMGILISHAAVFVLVAAGLVLAVQSGTTASIEKKRRLLRVLAGWAFSGAVVYIVYLRPLAVNPMLSKGASQFFIPRPLWSAGAVAQTARLVKNFFINPAGLFPAWLAALLMTAGVGEMVRVRKEWAVLLLAPGILALAASGLHLYPFSGRFVLFLLPAVFLFVSNALALLWRRALGYRISAVLLLMVFVFASSSLAFNPARRMPGTENAREIVALLRAAYHQGDRIYVNDGGQFAFWYYFQKYFKDTPVTHPVVVFADGMASVSGTEAVLEYFYLNPQPGGPGGAVSSDVRAASFSGDNMFKHRQRAWLVFLHYRETQIILPAYLRRVGRITLRGQAAYGALYFYEKQ